MFDQSKIRHLLPYVKYARKKDNLFNLLHSLHLVLRDVLRPQRGDAQAVGDCQATLGHRWTGAAIPLAGGEIPYFASC